jgi:hypothetical protein
LRACKGLIMKRAAATATLALTLGLFGITASSAQGLYPAPANSGYPQGSLDNGDMGDSGGTYTGSGNSAPGSAYTGVGNSAPGSAHTGVGVPTGGSGYVGKGGCVDCRAPRKHYDTQEVVKTYRNVDRSRVINTKSYVYKRPRAVYAPPVVRVPVVKVIEVVVQRYHVVEVPNYTYQPVVYRPAYRPVVHHPAKYCYGYGCSYRLRVRG